MRVFIVGHRGFTLIEILVAVAVIGIGFGMLLFTTLNIEKIRINNSDRIKNDMQLENRFNLYILNKTYNINYQGDDFENNDSIELDSNDTFCDDLILLKAEEKSDEENRIAIYEYALKR